MCHLFLTPSSPLKKKKTITKKNNPTITADSLTKDAYPQNCRPKVKKLNNKLDDQSSTLNFSTPPRLLLNTDSFHLNVKNFFLESTILPNTFFPFLFMLCFLLLFPLSLRKILICRLMSLLETKIECMFAPVCMHE